MPRSDSGISVEERFNKRSTTRSPSATGTVETRISISRSPTLTPAMPSCGRRFSAISRRAMILMRETSAASRFFGGDGRSYNMPSIRKRMRRLSAKGSMWMSEARSRSASSRIRLIRCVTGASSVPRRMSSLRVGATPRDSLPIEPMSCSWLVRFW